MTEVQLPTLVEFLKMLTTTVGLGMVISFVLSQLDKFQNITAQAKFWIVLVICLVLPLLATMVLNNVAAETLATLEPYWNALAAGFAVFIGSQVFYSLVVKNKAAAK